MVAGGVYPSRIVPFLGEQSDHSTRAHLRAGHGSRGRNRHLATVAHSSAGSAFGALCCGIGGLVSSFGDVGARYRGQHNLRGQPSHGRGCERFECSFSRAVWLCSALC
jgi:hypothetical protein